MFMSFEDFLRAIAQPVLASDAQAVCAIAKQHAMVLEQALPSSRVITPVLLGEMPENGYTAEIEWAAQEDGVTHVLTARVPDANRYLRVTYELVDLTRTVNYTGNGPEGKSVIGLDAIEAAIQHVDSVLEKIASLSQEIGREIPTDHERLIRRCLVALQEHTK